MSFSIPKDSESEYVPMDAKPLWLVPYVAGVDQRSPSLMESPWDERSDEEDCYVSESHCRHGLAQRSGERSRGQTISQGRHFSRSP